MTSGFHRRFQANGCSSFQVYRHMDRKSSTQLNTVNQCKIYVCYALRVYDVSSTLYNNFVYITCLYRFLATQELAWSDGFRGENSILHTLTCERT